MLAERLWAGHLCLLEMFFIVCVKKMEAISKVCV